MSKQSLSAKMLSDAVQYTPAEVEALQLPGAILNLINENRGRVLKVKGKKELTLDAQTVAIASWQEAGSPRDEQGVQSVIDSFRTLMGQSIKTNKSCDMESNPQLESAVARIVQPIDKSANQKIISMAYDLWRIAGSPELTSSAGNFFLEKTLYEAIIRSFITQRTSAPFEHHEHKRVPIRRWQDSSILGGDDFGDDNPSYKY